MMEVEVQEGQVDAAIKTLKKKLNRAGVFRKIKEKRFYEPPSAKKTAQTQRSFTSRQEKTQKATA